MRSRRYERIVGSWTQQVHIYRFRQSPGFAIELNVWPHDVAGSLFARHSKHGVNWHPRSSAFYEAERECCTRLLPFLDQLAAPDSPLESATAAELKSGGSCLDRFDQVWTNYLLFANVRWRDGRCRDAKEFAEGVVQHDLQDCHKERARFIISQIDAEQPYTAE